MNTETKTNSNTSTNTNTSMNTNMNMDMNMFYCKYLVMYVFANIYYTGSCSGTSTYTLHVNER
jgi:hypothetical protein